MLNEVKYSDLNNVKKVNTMDRLKQAAHSQGYSVSDKQTHGKYGSHSTVDITHRKTGESVKKPDGREAGGKNAGKGVDVTTLNTVASSIKNDARARGRVDKRPAAKAKRKSEAEANKAAKQKARDPFTRNKTFESFMIECASSQTDHYPHY